MVRHAVTFRQMLALLAVLISSGDGAIAASPSVSFVHDVKPLLARRCFSCHGPDIKEGGLRLDNADAALAELDSGLHAIIPGNVAESALLTRISTSDEAERMPPTGKPLSQEEVDILQSWIAGGAQWEKHWAFVPPERHAPPAVRDTAWPRNPIDAFVLARLETEGLSPSPVADKRTLARRAYFGVTGLPPTYEQLESFVADENPEAWNHLIDALLASPHYGEHWARHWLDLVRFAETNSFERDGLKPNAWKYRDYVIRSFNTDKPYDQFLREQLAGDELDIVTDESMIATGYYRLGTWDDEPADPLQARFDEFDDILSTTSQAILGLTIGCARCHDHKIDPILQRDYYGLLAFFADVTPYADIHDRDPARYSLWDMSTPADRARRDKLREKEETIRRTLTGIESVGIARMPQIDQEIARTPDRQKLIKNRLEQFLNISEWQLYQDTTKKLQAVENEYKSLPSPQAALALAKCDPTPPVTHIMLRGNPHSPGDAVEPSFPSLFQEQPPVIPPASENDRSAGRRRILADWIASPKNMLTARVIVNRVWQHHFGRGLVRSSNNFGGLGTPPTHPELLDYLALWLIDHDWQLKPLHRLIMTSNTYQMSSCADQKALAVDPANDLLWRFDMRRLSAEEIRDTVLVTSGQFNPAMFGPGFYPRLSQEVFATQSRPGDGWGESTQEERSRRSVYIHVKRSLLTPLLTAFDFPDVDSSCEARFVTTQPGQALAMLHGNFINEQAGELAKRVRQEAGPEAHDQVVRSIELALQRPARQVEIDDGLKLMADLIAKHGQSPNDALRYWCLTVLNLNEFNYLD